MDPMDLRARCDHVLELHEAGELDDALRAAERLADDAGDADLLDPVVRESLFTARFERALLLTELGDLEAAAEAYAAAAGTPADMDDPDQRHEVAMAGLNRGICLDAVGDHGGAIEAYDELLARFRDADDPVTLDQVLRARVNRAASLLAEDRVGEALTAAEVLIGELDPTDALEAEQLAMCVRLRGAALKASARIAEAADALAEVTRCAASDPAARTQVVAATRDRAQVLVELGRVEDAVAVLEEVDRRFEDDADPEVRDALAEAAVFRRMLAAG